MNNKRVPFILLFFSAILGNLALLYPAILSWLVFFYLIPIFYLAFTQPYALSFKAGFFWGVIFFLIHLSGFVFLFYEQANSALSIIIPIIISAYFALYTGVWFFLASHTACVFKHSITSTIVSWTIWTYLYITWMRYGSLWIFGKFVGYPFSYPLLPLAHNAKMLYFLRFCPKSIGVFLIILFSLFIALFFSFLKKRHLLLAIATLVPFLYGTVVVPEKQSTPEAIKKIGYISPIKAQKYNHPIDVAQEIFYSMVTLIEKKPNIKVIVMPESSYTFFLNERQDMIDMWYANALDDDISLFIGAPYRDGKKIYNSLYWIKGGRIQNVYHKTNLMAFTEYISSFWQKVPYIKNLFIDGDDWLSHGKDCLITFDLCKQIKLKPLICSDFFIGKRKMGKQLTKDNFSAALIIVNDQAFPVKYLRDLMFLSAKLEAVNRQKDMLYVGYYFAAWINKSGSVLIL